jgi:hypothetical protein
MRNGEKWVKMDITLPIVTNWVNVGKMDIRASIVQCAVNVPRRSKTSDVFEAFEVNPGTFRASVVGGK